MAAPRPQQSQSVPALWNKLPPEILGLILSNLGKHDLLTSRMVSRAWNNESLKVLKKSKFTQMLTESRIKEYLLFITATEPSPGPAIIPFNLNFRIHNYPRDSGLKALTPHVDSLCQIFGPQCVSTFTLTGDSWFNDEDEKEIGLIEFLELISLGLKTLDWRLFKLYNHVLENRIIKFPKLKKLTCNTSEWESGDVGPGLTYKSIIENSPNLEDLNITHSCDMESWPVNFNQLKSLSVVTLRKPENILNRILASPGPPVLRELNFRDYWDRTAEYKTVVHNILKSISSTLKSLKFRGRFNARNGRIRRLVTFPKLPHLEHLGLEYDIDFKHWINYEDINISAETFPSLKSIELPIGFIFTPSSPLQSQEEDDARIEFPNVTLAVRVGRTLDGDGPQDMSGPLEHLQKIFPNPSKLSFVNGGGHIRVNYLLERIIKSNWSKNIQEIQLIGFNHDYLGQVLETFVPPDSIISAGENLSDTFKMTDITTIKLELMATLYDPRFNSHLSATASIPNLIGFVQHFLQLRMIEVSELLFHEKHYKEWRSHVLEFKSKYPDVVLNVT